jgi:hypothetical protein
VRGLRAEANRADQAPGCCNSIDHHLLRYIWTFDRREKPRIDAAIARFAPRANVMRLRGDRVIASFLNALPMAA